MLPRAVFYGWKIVATAHVSSLICSASLFYSFPIFLVPLSEELGIGRAVVSLVPVLTQVFGGFAAFGMGEIVGRVSIRRIMLGGALLAAFGYLAASMATHIAQLCVIAAVCFSIGGQALIQLLPQALIVNWFERLRGRALGITQLGVSLGGVIGGPLIAYSVQTWGWRASYQLMAATFLIAFALIATFVVNRPEDRGLQPDGGAIEPGPDTAAPRAIGLKGRANPQIFWVICAMMAGSYLAGPALMPHLVPMAIDRGVLLVQASTLVMVVALGSMTAKLLFGLLIERLPMRAVFFVMASIQLLGLGMFVLAEGNWFGAETPQQHFLALIAAAVPYALGVGGLFPVSTALVSDAFGRVRFSQQMGRLVMVMVPAAGGSFVAGWVFDTYGFYAPVFLALFALTALSALAGLLYPLPQDATQA